MSPIERRKSSEGRSLLRHAGDAISRVARNQSRFSVATSALAGVLVLTLILELFGIRPNPGRETIPAWLVTYAVFALLPLVFGKRFPLAAGLAFIAFVAFWSAYSVSDSSEVRGFLSALLEAPMIGLYLGWFYRGLMARLSLVVFLSILSVAVLVETNEPSGQFSTILVLAYAVLVSVFCLETGAYLNRRSERRAMTDHLTRTLNRRGLSKFAATAIARAEATGGTFSFFAIDFDNFKAINDSGGHAAGDAALIDCSESWLAASTGDDLVARLGGDEFALLIHGESDAACARVLSLRTASPYEWSWGHIEYQPGDTLDSLMQRADRELLVQKRLNAR